MVFFKNSFEKLESNAIIVAKDYHQKLILNEVTVLNFFSLSFKLLGDKVQQLFFVFMKLKFIKTFLLCIFTHGDEYF